LIELILFSFLISAGTIQQQKGNWLGSNRWCSRKVIDLLRGGGKYPGYYAEEKQRACADVEKAAENVPWTSV
jgi:hypothetical protein